MKTRWVKEKMRSITQLAMIMLASRIVYDSQREMASFCCDRDRQCHYPRPPHLHATEPRGHRDPIIIITIIIIASQEPAGHAAFELRARTWTGLLGRQRGPPGDRSEALRYGKLLQTDPSNRPRPDCLDNSADSKAVSNTTEGLLSL